jgi:undecaprenyl phosphate-alpha-L-ara4N flippase subunit ArnE
LSVILGPAFVSLLLAAGQVFLKGALSEASGDGFGALLKATLTTWKGWTAMLCTGAATLLWLKVLSKVDLGVAYPLISLSYIFALALAALFLQEQISIRHWAGVLLICAGVALVNFKG